MKIFYILTILALCILACIFLPPVSAITWTDAGGCYTATDGAYGLIKVNATGAFSIPVPSVVTQVWYLVVAGGAGGYNLANSAGGGGAGGVRMNSTSSLLSVSGVMTGVVGAGGPVATNGTNSSFESISATGGGRSDFPGGSGGGGDGWDAVARSGGAGNLGGYTPVEGYAGGSTTDTFHAPGGGGGGAGGAGESVNSASVNGGAGGIGILSNITGVPTYYGGGGGAGNANASGTGGTGGLGGGGNGGTGGTAATAGTNEFGGGGGGTGSGAAGVGGSGVVIIKYLIPVSAPVSSFDQNVTVGIDPTVVLFTDTSTNSPTSWIWKFTNKTGNNTLVQFSTLQNPTQSFGVGNYTINLTATNAGGSDTSKANHLLNVSVGTLYPIAAFLANKTAIYVNDYVKFTDSSTSTPTSWDWGFGDGTANGTTQNPEHQYTAVGSYSVRLNASNSYGYNDTTKINYIIVSTVPPPSAPSFTANKTYLISLSDVVQFNVTSADPINPTSWNMSFGDGGWSNVTTSLTKNVTHTYTAPNTYSPTLYVYNTAGVASTTNTNYIVVSQPSISALPNPRPINRGVPQNITISVNNISHISNLVGNITFNKTSLQVLDISPVQSGHVNIGGIDNTNGFVFWNLTMTDTSYTTPTNVVTIQFNVTDGWKNGNSTEPLTFVLNTGVMPNASYSTPALYAFSPINNGAIEPADDVLTQTFTFYRSDTGELINNVQITNVYEGITTGTTSTTTGSQSISSKWGFINLTSTASGYYESKLYYLEIKGDTTTVKLTPYAPSGNTVFYVPYQVRLKVVDAYGVPIPYAHVNLSYLSSSLPNTDISWLILAFGIKTSVAEEMVNGSMFMKDYAGDDGSLVFTAFAGLRYKAQITNSTIGLNHNVILTPKDSDYIVYCPLAGQVRGNNTMANIVNTSLPYYIENASAYTMGVIYQDTGSCTSNVEFIVKYRNGTIVYDHNNPVIGITPIIDNFTVLRTGRGTEIMWSYNATKVC